MTVLIVDDREDNRYLLETVLSGEGHTVISAQDGAQALDLLSQHPCDAIISDILMPGIDGFELCRTVRKNPAWADVPFLFYTATYTGKQDEELARRLGADAFILKPCEPDEFVRLFNETVAQKKAQLPGQAELLSPGSSAETAAEAGETEVLKLYNQRLVRKLEQKMEQLEEEMKRRERSEQLQHLLEEQFLQLQKMELIGRLTGGIAHDFNNMLGVILGYSDMALEMVEADHPVHEQLLGIQKSALLSKELTTRLLGFARKQAAEPQVFTINEVMDRSRTILLRLIGDEAQLQWKLGQELPKIKGDPVHIDQILTNLCINARDAVVDAMRGKGIITVETSMVNLDCASNDFFPDCTPGEYVCLAVGDNGSGMDDQTKERIFEPFYTTKEAGRGTGLGLSLVYSLVTQNRGMIHVYSEPGVGTAMRVYFPAAQTRPEPGAVEALQGLYDADRSSLEHTGKQKHKEAIVVLAEDDPSILQLSSMVLRSLGCRVLAAQDARKAIDAVRTAGAVPDLLITDLVMPETSGRELAAELRALYPDMKVLLMSGYSPDVIGDRKPSKEEFHFIQKPFSLKSLAAVVTGILKNL
jgi:CheY-like chemotaxis protein